MNRPRRLVLIRHGESARNVAKSGKIYFVDDAARSRVQGIPDHQIPLTNNGWEQARQTGRALAALPFSFDYAYHSGYERTRQTLEGILEAFTPEARAAINVRHNLFIRERDPGYAYDMTEEEALDAFPHLHEYWLTFGGFFARPPGGESIADVCARVHTVLDSFFRDRAGENLLVTTHGGTIRAFRFLLERWEYNRAIRWSPDEPPKNCSVTTYEYDRDSQRLVLVTYNQVFW